MDFIETIQDPVQKINFIRVIKQISEKKIYLEVEYARCCMKLVKYNENEINDLAEAAKIMGNV